jgi:hypothetical protein
MGTEMDMATLLGSPLFSEELGIRIEKNTDAELFKWFLASILFGARISETIARNTYGSFKKRGLLTPARIISAGWDYLVNPVMREGGYVRYDGKTSSKMLKICGKLMREYGGSLKKLHGAAKDSADLEARLLDFYGIGPVTVNIFLRELRPFWEKADPEPLPAVKETARRLKVDLDCCERKSLDFARLEAGLIRMRKIAHRPAVT